MLGSWEGSDAFHPATDFLCKHLVYNFKRAKRSDCDDCIRLLNLLREVFNCFPRKMVQELCENILRLLSLQVELLSHCALGAVERLCTGNEDACHKRSVRLDASNSAGASVPTVTFPVKMNAQLIGALFEHAPAASHAAATVQWIRTCVEAHVLLARRDGLLGIRNLERLLRALLDLTLSESHDVVGSAVKALHVATTEILPCSPRDMAYDAATKQPDDNPVVRCVRVVASSLKYRHKQQWGAMLDLVRDVVETMGDLAAFLGRTLIISACELRATDAFAQREQVDRLMACAIKTMGVRAFLDIVPLGLDDALRAPTGFHLPAAWLLALVRDNICVGDDLAYYAEHLVPLAQKYTLEVERLRALDARARDAATAERFKAVEVVCGQLWAMLPMFMRAHAGTDLTAGLGKIAKILGMALASYAFLRPTVCNALAVCISSHLLLRQTVSDAADARIVDNNLKCIASFAKNFLPILFNMLKDTPASQRAYIKVTINRYSEKSLNGDDDANCT